jgi:diaminohydroxyphosphoribosylaminopyrimidine deaminase/5-amino-6-(5-phosphoribosylamino)uracil reductase
MTRCLELAARGLGNVAPNPMVGAVIVCDGKIIGEGYHERFGEAHAEVNAINSVKERSLLKRSTLYVSLEPCSHHGKTPPCVDLIILHQIPYVVIGCVDTNPLVKGKGIQKLVEEGVDVKTGVLEKECRNLNKRFFTFHEQKRPYIILKWAQTADGFLDKKRKIGDGQKPLTISNERSVQLSHQWRSQEQAIMVGTNTALLDDPELTVRLAKGKNPLRVLLDRNLRVPPSSHLLDGSTPTLVLNEKKIQDSTNLEYYLMDFSMGNKFIENIMQVLYRKNIQSVIIEGGAQLLNSWISHGWWDEARIFISKDNIGDGVKAPELNSPHGIEQEIGDNKLRILINPISEKLLNLKN